MHTILHGDCIEQMRTLPDNSVALIATDPPYYRVKGEAWDRQWETPTAFLSWVSQLCEEWQRILKPNGSLYVFASPRMAARVEVTIAERFNVLNRITWRKHDGTYNEGGLWSRADKDSLRRFFEQKEEVIFAEHYGADNMAKGEAGYEAKCDELRGFVFEPVRKWFVSAWERSGLSRRVVDEACNTSNVTQYWFLERNYQIPTPDKYAILQSLAPHAFTREYDDLRREYDDLRREYDDLRREYDDLRRPFAVTADVPYTDVWNFPTVAYYPGKHPCEKPVAMMEHIIRTSSRPGDTVLDCFMGSGSTLVAAQNLGRHGIGIELNEAYIAQARRRLGQVAMPLEMAAG